ncbi:MAG TPA: protease inhibitor I42 family protein [Methanosarcina sp.]|nr:protease inhibitor I42 family protein [Methanosarcina sp.]
MKKVLKAIAVLFIVAAVVFAAGCTGKTGNTGNETQGNETQGNTDQLQPVNPETSANVTDNMTGANKTIAKGQIVTEADNGKTISLKNGENFTVSLREDPSAGYLWELNLSNGLSILDDEYIEGLNPENLTGVPGTHLWVIEATAPGSQKVNGIYRRSWENITGTEEKFTLGVEVE